MAGEKTSETLCLLMLFHATPEKRCGFVKYWKRGMYREMETVYSHDRHPHPTGWSRPNSALLKLVIDEQRCTKVKQRPTFPGWHTVIPAKRLPWLGCLAHGKSGVWPLKTECQASCIVEAQREREQDTGIKRHGINRKGGGRETRPLLPLSDFVTRFNDVSDSPRQVCISRVTGNKCTYLQLWLMYVKHQKRDLAPIFPFAWFNFPKPVSLPMTQL